jgi:6-phospho-beta-glucosidase
MGVRIAVIGGGSTYTPELIEGIVTRTERLPVDELILQDISAERLGIVGGLAGRMTDRIGWSGRLRLATDLDEAIDGADFVLIQLRVGGQAARQVDETLPTRFGTIGQETTGAGGFAKALRTLPVILDIAERVRERAAPSAWIVDFANPVGIVTQALLDGGHRAIGLCNVAINLQRRLAAELGLPPDQVELEHVGLNHLSWIRAVKVGGADRLPQLLDQRAQMLADEVDIPVELVRSSRTIPSYYLRYYWCFGEVLEAQRTGATSRAEQVAAIERDLLEQYRDPTLDRKPELLATRGGAFYSEAAAQLIASLYDGSGDVQVVDTYNRGALPDLPDTAVVEVAARIDRDGPHPIPVAPLAPELRALVQHAKAYEELAIEAARTGDRTVALRALLANPLVHGYDMAAPLLDATLETDRAHLPRFFPTTD